MYDKSINVVQKKIQSHFYMKIQYGCYPPYQKYYNEQISSKNGEKNIQSIL